MNDDSQLPDDQLTNQQEPSAPDDGALDPLAQQRADRELAHDGDVQDMSAPEPIDATAGLPQEHAADIESLAVSVNDLDISEPSKPVNYHGDATREAAEGLSDEIPGGEELATEVPDTTELRDEHDADIEGMRSNRSPESFGDKLSRFNDAGGADADFDLGDGEDGGESKDSGQQLMDSDYSNRSQMSDMLIEHARRLDELTGALERERL